MLKNLLTTTFILYLNLTGLDLQAGVYSEAEFKISENGAAEAGSTEFALMVGASSNPEPKRTLPLTMLTYNVKGADMNTERLHNIVKIIQAVKPQLVAIQEIDKLTLRSGFRDWLKELGEAIGMQHHFWETVDHTIGSYGIGILTETTPVSVNGITFPKAPGSGDKENRGVITAEFKDFLFMSTHFSLDADDRDLAAQEIISQAKATGKITFAAGDFNAKPNYRAMVAFQNNGFSILNNISEFTFPSDDPASCIDFVMCHVPNSSGLDVNVTSTGIAHTEGVNLIEPSDHLPVFVSVDINGIPVATHTVTVAEGGAEVEGSLPYCIANAADGDKIVFNLDGKMVLHDMPVAQLKGKKLVIDGLNQFNEERVTVNMARPGQGFIKIYSNEGTPGVLELSNLIFTQASNTLIDARPGTQVDVENCVFKDNDSQANNGGVFRIQGKATINHTFFENNKTAGTYGGGALCIYNSAEVSISNSTFVGNKSMGTGRTGGGAMVVRPTAMEPANVSISNCTFAHNSARFGGAVLASVQSSNNYAGNVYMVHCTFTGNQGNGGALATLFNQAGTIHAHLVNSLAVHNFNSDATAYDDLARIYEEGSTGETHVTIWNSIYGTSSGSFTSDASLQINYTQPPSVFAGVKTTGSLVSGILSSGSEMPVVPLAGNSIALGAGRNSVPAPLQGIINIPETDQLGKLRPAEPASGAVEYDGPVKIENVPANADSLTVWKEGNRLFFSGAEFARMDVFSVTGQLIHSAYIAEGEGIDLSSIQNGFYIVKVTAEEMIKTVKVVF